MARIVVVGSVAQDDVLTLRQPLSAGCHLDAAGRSLARFRRVRYEDLFADDYTGVRDTLKFCGLTPRAEPLRADA